MEEYFSTILYISCILACQVFYVGGIKIAYNSEDTINRTVIEGFNYIDTSRIDVASSLGNPAEASLSQTKSNPGLEKYLLEHIAHNSGLTHFESNAFTRRNPELSGFEGLDLSSRVRELEIFEKIQNYLKSTPIGEYLFENIVFLDVIGKDRIHFDLLKIRTMEKGADKNHAKFLELVKSNGLDEYGKPKNDVRIIPEREEMRDNFFDEILQIINWLKGDLDFWGMRPKTPSMLTTYAPRLQNMYLQRKPGLIGIHRLEIPREETIRRAMVYHEELDDMTFDDITPSILKERVLQVPDSNFKTDDRIFMETEKINYCVSMDINLKEANEFYRPYVRKCVYRVAKKLVPFMAKKTGDIATAPMDPKIAHDDYIAKQAFFDALMSKYRTTLV